MEDKKLGQATMLRFSHKDVITHDIKSKYQGFFRLDEYQVSHRLFNGTISKTLTREVFERGDAVVLILYDANKDKLLLIEQFRPGAVRHQDSPWMLELIAGMFDADENPVDVAVREAKDEANIDVSSDKVTQVMEYLSSPGGMSERIYLMASNFDSDIKTGVHGLDEEGEDILTHIVTREEALELLQQGKIVNAATIIGLQWLALNYQQLKDKWYN